MNAISYVSTRTSSLFFFKKIILNPVFPSVSLTSQKLHHKCRIIKLNELTFFRIEDFDEYSTTYVGVIFMPFANYTWTWSQILQDRPLHLIL